MRTQLEIVDALPVDADGRFVQCVRTLGPGGTIQFERFRDDVEVVAVAIRCSNGLIFEQKLYFPTSVKAGLDTLKAELEGVLA